MNKRNPIPPVSEQFDLPKGAIASIFRRRDQLREDLSALERVLKMFYQNGTNGHTNGGPMIPNVPPVLAEAIALDAARRDRLAVKAFDRGVTRAVAKIADDHSEQRDRAARRCKAERAATRKRTAAFLAQFTTHTGRAPRPGRHRDNRAIGSLIYNGYLKPGKIPGEYVRTAKPFGGEARRGTGAGKRPRARAATIEAAPAEARTRRRGGGPKQHPGGDTERREQIRAQSAAVLAEFDEATPKPAPSSAASRLIGPLVRRGYLKKAPGGAGYLRTGKVFTVSVSAAARSSA